MKKDKKEKKYPFETSCFFLAALASIACGLGQPKNLQLFVRNEQTSDLIVGLLTFHRNYFYASLVAKSKFGRLCESKIGIGHFDSTDFVEPKLI